MPKDKPTKVLEITALFLAFVLVAMGSVLILKSKEKNSEQLSEKLIDQSETQIQNTTASAINTFNTFKKPSERAFDEKENLTEILGAKLAQEIIKAEFNPEKINISPEDLGDPEEEFPLVQIPDEEIKISEDNSKESVLSYVASMAKALSYGALPIEYFENLQQKGIENLTAEDMPEIHQLLNDYERSIREIKEVFAPSSWKKIQKNQLAILSLTYELLQVISSSNEDPLRAELALIRIKDMPIMLDELAEEVKNLAQKQQLSSL